MLLRNEGDANQKVLTRGRTDQFSTQNSTNNQLERKHWVQRVPPPRQTEIGTVSLPLAFLAMRRNWFIQLHFHFSINRLHP